MKSILDDELLPLDDGTDLPITRASLLAAGGDTLGTVTVWECPPYGCTYCIGSRYGIEKNGCPNCHEPMPMSSISAMKCKKCGCILSICTGDSVNGIFKPVAEDTEDLI